MALSLEGRGGTEAMAFPWQGWWNPPKTLTVKGSLARLRLLGWGVAGSAYHDTTPRDAHWSPTPRGVHRNSPTERQFPAVAARRSREGMAFMLELCKLPHLCDVVVEVCFARPNKQPEAEVVIGRC